MNQMIGHYEVLEVLGDGGMGTVYRARDPRFDRLVAIKMLHPNLQRDPEVVERFRSEAVIQAKLNHPNIITVYDFVADDHILAMVMEFVEGKPLDVLLEGASDCLSTERTVRIFQQLLSAMSFAHKQGLVHRDLKPSNVIVHELDGEEIIKVLDFGVAKILGSDKLRTATSAKMGTLCYMSPEQLRSPKSVDRRSDIYSLGVILYEMLSGQLPFDAETEFELMCQTIETEARPLHEIRPGLAPDLEAMVQRALAKDPADRFQSCADWLQSIHSDSPSTMSTAAGPPSVVRTATVPAKPRRSGVLIGKVAPGGPADWAKLRPGDRILEVNNEAVDAENVVAVLAPLGGRLVKLTLWRGMRKEWVTVTPKEGPRGGRIGIEISRDQEQGAPVAGLASHRAPSRDGWHYSMDGQVYGPMSWKNLVHQTARNPNIRVWHQALAEWQLLSDVEARYPGL